MGHSFIVSVEMEIDDALALRNHLMCIDTCGWNAMLEALERSIKVGAFEMLEAGLEVPDGV